MSRWEPMLATPIPAPFDSEEYVFEVKWDGLRCVCQVEAGTVRLFSRTGRDMTAQFPELQGLGQAVGVPFAVLDGEVCVLEGGVPSFHLVQRRNLLTSAAAIRKAAAEHPAVYIAFDLLELDSRPLLSLPWQRRREELEGAWRGDSDYTTLSPVVPGRGRDLYAASVARGLEGIVAKHIRSPYVPGRRTRHWLKVRREHELDCVVGGYVPRGALGLASLALGLYPPAEAAADGGLIYVGNVGTGFTDATRTALMARLLALRTTRSPFGDAGPEPPQGTQWVLPRLVVRVAYLEFTSLGHLRHPTFRGLREDKAPRDCRFPVEADEEP